MDMLKMMCFLQTVMLYFALGIYFVLLYLETYKKWKGLEQYKDFKMCQMCWDGGVGPRRFLVEPF